jgi:hypothetical protein
MPRDIYTADMGQPPSPDEGAMPKKPMKRPPVRDVYTAEMGQPPMPDEGAPPKMAPRKAKAKPFAKGGSVGSASKRADGIAQRGKTKGRII